MDGHRRNRRSSGDLSIEDDFEESAEELELLGEDHDPSKRGSDVMSITDDVDTQPMLAHKEWHVTLFGEIKHDQDDAVNFNQDDLVRSEGFSQFWHQQRFFAKQIHKMHKTASFYNTYVSFDEKKTY